MVYLTYTYSVNDTQHLRTIRKAITGHLKDYPLYVYQIGDRAQLEFDTNEDGYFIEENIAEAFPDHEFISDLSWGDEQILLSITRIQSPNSGDDWGRGWNENTLVSEKHLVKRRERPNPLPPRSTFWAFFGEEVHEYKVHVGIVEKGTPKEGYVVVDGAVGDDGQRKILSEIFSDNIEAFWQGVQLLKTQIEAEFNVYDKKQHKKKPTKRND